MIRNYLVGKGSKYAVHCTAVYCGKDISIAISGGTLEHIGAVALAVYEPLRNSATVSTVSVFSHRDDQIAAIIAKKISSQCKCTVTASVGVHLDNATSEDIKILQNSCIHCCDLVLADKNQQLL